MSKEPKKIRLMLVDDHFFVREGLTTSLALEDDIEVIAEASGVAEAVDLVNSEKPDLMLLDGSLTDGHGREVIKQISANKRKTGIILFSVDTSEESVFQAMNVGADGYLSKTAPRKELLKAIRIVADGGEYLSSDLRALLSKRDSQQQLTPREMEVLEKVAAGEPNKMIALMLGISETTVKVHLSRVFEKLEVQDRTSATTAALRKGLIQLT